MAKKDEARFEDNLQALDKLVAAMEKGNLSLEESLKSYTDGVKLIEACQKMLKQSEQKVKILSQAEKGDE